MDQSGTRVRAAADVGQLAVATPIPPPTPQEELGLGGPPRHQPQLIQSKLRTVAHAGPAYRPLAEILADAERRPKTVLQLYKCYRNMPENLGKRDTIDASTIRRQCSVARTARGRTRWRLRGMSDRGGREHDTSHDVGAGDLRGANDDTSAGYPHAAHGNSRLQAPANNRGTNLGNGSGMGDIRDAAAEKSGISGSAASSSNSAIGRGAAAVARVLQGGSGKSCGSGKSAWVPVGFSSSRAVPSAAHRHPPSGTTRHVWLPKGTKSDQKSSWQQREVDGPLLQDRTPEVKAPHWATKTCRDRGQWFKLEVMASGHLLILSQIEDAPTLKQLQIQEQQQKSKILAAANEAHAAVQRAAANLGAAAQHKVNADYGLAEAELMLSVRPRPSAPTLRHTKTHASETMCDHATECLHRRMSQVNLAPNASLARRHLRSMLYM